ESAAGAASQPRSTLSFAFFSATDALRLVLFSATAALRLALSASRARARGSQFCRVASAGLDGDGRAGISATAGVVVSVFALSVLATGAGAALPVLAIAGTGLSVLAIGSGGLATCSCSRQ